MIFLLFLYIRKYAMKNKWTFSDKENGVVLLVTDIESPLCSNK